MYWLFTIKAKYFASIITFNNKNEERESNINKTCTQSLVNHTPLESVCLLPLHVILDTQVITIAFMIYLYMYMYVLQVVLGIFSVKSFNITHRNMHASSWKERLVYKRSLDTQAISEVPCINELQRDLSGLFLRPFCLGIRTVSGPTSRIPRTQGWCWNTSPVSHHAHQFLGSTHRRTRHDHSTTESEGFSDTFTVVFLLSSFVHSFSSTQFLCCCYAQLHVCYLICF